MNSRQRWMTVLEIPDRSPFADWIDMDMKEKFAMGLGKEGMNDAQLAKALEMNALNPTEPL